MSSDISIPLKIKIKQEKLSPKPQKKPDIEELASTTISPIPEEKKVIEPIKSSNEILAELFQVFNAAPPQSVLSNNIEDLIKYEKMSLKKQQKKHKKKHNDNSEDKSNKKHKKSKKSDKIKTENNVSDKELDNDNETENSSKKKHHHHKKSKKRKKSRTRNKSEERSEKMSQNSPTSEEKPSKPVESTSKIIIKDLKNSKILESIVSSRTRSNSNTSEYDDLSSELSLSDEFESSSMYYTEGSKKSNEFYHRSKKHRSRSRDNNRHLGTSSKHRSSNDRDYNKHNSYYTSSYRDRQHYHHRSFSRSRSRSRSGERIDKKRLLEIARKNAITMLKSGTLPGSQYLALELKEKALEKMRYGGKSIEELTEYCRKLSNGENLGDLSSVSGEDDSDHDKEGNEKAFHHPFVLKERGPIVMNIKNSVPIQPKSAEQTKAILMQYPVSSGTQHRLNEPEWMPVEPKKPTPVPKKNVPPTRTQPSSWPLNNKSKNNQQGILTTNQKIVEQPVIIPENIPIQYPIGHTLNQTNYPLNQQPPETVFPDTSAAGNLDISSIITQRLNAMRKLQENPHDFEAQGLMNNAQQDMSIWLNSKHTPGQFTGSTGAHILSARELARGIQSWARRDQNLVTTPVSGGMGMHLLQKMGWKPGEGLGKDKTGSLEPLLLEVKLDKKGLLADEENPQHLIRKKTRETIRKNLESKHPVSLLGETAAKRKWIVPAYAMVTESGPGHNKNFLFKVTINGKEYTPTDGAATKKEAKAVAAKFALQKMGILSS